MNLWIREIFHVIEMVHKNLQLALRREGELAGENHPKAENPREAW
jgi:hypothetical protein